MTEDSIDLNEEIKKRAEAAAFDAFMKMMCREPIGRKSLYQIVNNSNPYNNRELFEYIYDNLQELYRVVSSAQDLREPETRRQVEDLRSEVQQAIKAAKDKHLSYSEREDLRDIERAFIQFCCDKIYPKWNRFLGE